ncbi:MAG: 2OG-Fe(II) oxygenase [Acidobacteria bacterium]|nr:2OG-Fe(II) oxygenase [Acidobacteriota bacterium]
MSTPDPARPLEAGDRFPEIIRQGPDGRAIALYEFLVGEPALVAVSSSVVADAATLIAFDRLVSEQTHYNAAIVAAGALPELQSFVTENQIKTPVVVDDGRAVAACLGRAPNRPARFFALDPTVRIDAVAQTVDDAASIAPQANEEARAWRIVGSTAPVLIVPNVLEPELIQACIDAYESDNTESGMVRFVDGAIELVPDAARKVRRDHTVEDPDLLNLLSDRIARRVLPEIQKAFFYPVTRFEKFKVVCYEANEAERQAGYFRLHRDNLTPDARHRRFAMTLNLNAGEYDGGFLRFPEFGPELYNPPTGAAIVFSCAHLHEATDVTRGRRFALLTFFFGEEATQARRQAEQQQQQ